MPENESVFVDFFDSNENYLDGTNCEPGHNISEYDGVARETLIIPVGYIFESWNKLDEYMQLTDEVITTIPDVEYLMVGAKLQQSASTHLLTITYRDNHGIVVAPTYSNSYEEGQSYSVTSPTVADFTPDIAVVSGIMGSQDITVNVVYTSSQLYLLTINYIDDEGNTVANAYVAYKPASTSYSVTSPTITHYYLVDSAQATIAGTMPNEDVTVNVVYSNKHTLTITCVEEQHYSTVLEIITETFAYGERYSVDLPEIEGFTRITDSPITGTMREVDITITAEYRRNSYDLYIEYLYAFTGETVRPSTHRTPNYHQSYSITPTAYPGYAPSLSVVSGIMPAHRVDVTVLYYSTDYKEAITRLTRQEDIYGTITFPDGTSEDLTTSNIQQGSVSITRQCVDSEELMFGGVVLSELDMGIWSDRSRYDFYDAKISLTYKIWQYIQDGVDYWTEIPLGLFTVNEADRTNQFVSITAYDNLQKLDKEIGTTTFAGLPYTILKNICDLCDIQLAITYSDVANLPNGEENLSITQDVGKTWREAVKAICQMLGCFATVDRYGNLILKQFGVDSVRNYTGSNRTAVTIADYQCSYYKLVISCLQGEYSSTELGITNPLVMYMDAPAWDYGLPLELQERADNLMDYLVDIEYTPCELTIWGDPALECGDRITNIVGEEEIESLVTSYTWNFRNMMTVSSVGKNPLFVENEKESGARSASSSIAQSKLVIYELTNRIRVIIPEDTPTLVGETTYYATKDTYAIYQGNLQINLGEISNSFANITVQYIIDDYMLEPANITVSRLPSGKNVIPLFFLISAIGAGAQQKLSIYVFSDDGEIIVEAFDLKSTVSGQNLVDLNDVWNGRLSANDLVSGVNIGTNFAGAEDSTPIIEFPTIISRSSMSDIISTFTLSLIPSSRDILEIPEDSTGTYTFAPFFGEYGADNRLTTNCAVSDDRRSWIGAGIIGTNANEITTEAIYGITKLAIFYTGSPQAKLSNDGGTTWLGYNRGTNEWSATNYMDMSEVNALSSSILAAFEGSDGIMIKIYVAEGTSIHSINAEGGTLSV